MMSNNQDAAIEAAWKSHFVMWRECSVRLQMEYRDYFEAGYKAALESVAWVRCEDRLPKKQGLGIGVQGGKYVNTVRGEEEVLITTNLGRVLCRRFTSLGFPNLKFGEKEEAVAWMPLPKPYESTGE